MSLDLEKKKPALLDKYHTGQFYDEMYDANNCLRKELKSLAPHINALSFKQLKKKQKAAELAFFQQGITFNVYGNKKAEEKVFPFDILPRIVPKCEWEKIEKGLKQRTLALNLFLDDIYNEQKILKDKVIPKELLLSSDGYLKACQGIKAPAGIWIHITGTDLIRDRDGSIYVLEDNLRCPSGISYVLQNRAIQKRIFPAAIASMRVRPVSNYTDQLYSTLRHAGSTISSDPLVVVLTPGIYNSAYFEHAYLAQQMGVMLAEGRDLSVKDDCVFLKTTKGLLKVDVLYRRIDDSFLDPLEFNPQSLLGVPALMNCFRKGNLALANAPGSGVADDKAIYAYVPKIIKYYLDQDPLIPNVPTYLCSDNKERAAVVQNLENFVVKPSNGSGGYGMLIGSQSSKEERLAFSKKIEKNPRLFIAQPIMSLSRCPTVIGDSIQGRHVDLRPYILYGSSLYVLPGGLTRVALIKDSLVVNSSQGGGSKDTWVLGNNHSDIEEPLDA